MIIHKLELEGVILFEPKQFSDSRGVFYETFQHEKFEEITGEPVHFVQDNESISKKGVVRGLHFQKPPFAQGKLVRVVNGSVLDVLLDIRKNSPTYGKHLAIELSAINKLILWIPPGFAHGFSALQDDAVFQYKCSNYYHPQSEQTILWNSPLLEINWKVENCIVSEKDQEGIDFSSFETPFV